MKIEGDIMRVSLLGFVVAVAVLWAPPERATAASACTAWIEFKGTQDECMQVIAIRAGRAKLKSAKNGATNYFWFDNNVVTTRCISEKGVIAIAAYHTENDRACPLSDRVRKAIE
jgi:hypothetical protein